MKNLFDISKQIKNTMNFINKNDEHITSVEINQKTLDYLKTENIYGFSDAFNKVIPVIINNYMNDNEIKFNREKNNKVTEYDNFIKEYESITQASKELNNSLNNISQCCLGRSRTSKGYIFKFKNDEEILQKYKSIIGVSDEKKRV